MRNCKFFALLALAGLVVASTPAVAHHSFTMFDNDNPIELDGEVVRFRFLNPHSWITVVADDPATGETREWELEFGPINMLSRRGWNRDTLQPGDRVRVKVEPMRDGSPAARLLTSGFLEGPERIPETMAAPQTVERPEPVAMSDEVARDFNGIWVSAIRGLNFQAVDTPADEQSAPLTPDFQAQLDAKKALADQGILSSDPTAACTPAGFPRLLSMVFPGEILQNDKQLNWYVEWNQETVRIYLDGREAPPDLLPSYTGFSTGRWEGNTLVVQTTHLRDDTLVDNTGVPHSDQLEVEMRMTKLTPDFFEVELTLTDPVAFTQPWSSVRRYQRAPAHYMAQEYNCFEGNRHRVNEDGTVELDLY